jgi:hypothetical protein
VAFGVGLKTECGQQSRRSATRYENQTLLATSGMAPVHAKTMTRYIGARYKREALRALARAGVDTNGATIKDEPSPGSKQKFAATGDNHRCQNIDLK